MNYLRWVTETSATVVNMNAFKAKIQHKKLKEVEKELRDMGMVITHLSNTDEYRVNYKNGREATAYYTNDLQDAALTGYAMSQHEDPYSS